MPNISVLGLDIIEILVSSQNIFTLEIVTIINLLIVIFVVGIFSKCSTRPHPPIFSVTETSLKTSQNHDKNPDCHLHSEEGRAVAGKLSRAAW